jgi:2,3-diketo-5-methylthio-1-phosphopentane phosphatase
MEDACPRRAMTMKALYAVFTDFDGTVTTTDSLQRLLTVFAGDAWREIERQSADGTLEERTSLQREFDLVRATEEEAMAVIDRDVAVAPSFPRFASWLDELRTPLVVVSGGFGKIIRRILSRCGLGRLEVRSNEVRIDGGKWTVVPAGGESLCGRCNHCKAASLDRAKRGGARVAFIGNGLTDRCPAAYADIRFAKGELAAHCREKKLPYHSYNDFDQVKAVLEKELAG